MHDSRMSPEPASGAGGTEGALVQDAEPGDWKFLCAGQATAAFRYVGRDPLLADKVLKVPLRQDYGKAAFGSKSRFAQLFFGMHEEATTFVESSHILPMRFGLRRVHCFVVESQVRELLKRRNVKGMVDGLRRKSSLFEGDVDSGKAASMCSDDTHVHCLHKQGFVTCVLEENGVSRPACCCRRQRDVETAFSPVAIGGGPAEEAAGGRRDSGRREQREGDSLHLTLEFKFKCGHPFGVAPIAEQSPEAAQRLKSSASRTGAGDDYMQPLTAFNLSSMLRCQWGESSRVCLFNPARLFACESEETLKEQLAYLFLRPQGYFRIFHGGLLLGPDGVAMTETHANNYDASSAASSSGSIEFMQVIGREKAGLLNRFSSNGNNGHCQRHQQIIVPDACDAPESRSCPSGGAVGRAGMDQRERNVFDNLVQFNGLVGVAARILWKERYLLLSLKVVQGWASGMDLLAGKLFAALQSLAGSAPRSGFPEYLMTETGIENRVMDMATSLAVLRGGVARVREVAEEMHMDTQLLSSELADAVRSDQEEVGETLLTALESPQSAAAKVIEKQLASRGQYGSCALQEERSSLGLDGEDATVLLVAEAAMAWLALYCVGRTTMDTSTFLSLAEFEDDDSMVVDSLSSSDSDGLTVGSNLADPRPPSLNSNNGSHPRFGRSDDSDNHGPLLTTTLTAPTTTTAHPTPPKSQQPLRLRCCCNEGGAWRRRCLPDGYTPLEDDRSSLTTVPAAPVASTDTTAAVANNSDDTATAASTAAAASAVSGPPSRPGRPSTRLAYRLAVIDVDLKSPSKIAKM
eukprot:GHVU01096408.1.p1 GENE.GHVU01096408.1~~GHVU01096408.1.p1  ORF type:complete len:805 (+),score=101.90 GHVU01096408.1:311-2725(+)